MRRRLRPWMAASGRVEGLASVAVATAREQATVSGGAGGAGANQRKRKPRGFVDPGLPLNLSPAYAVTTFVERRRRLHRFQLPNLEAGLPSTRHSVGFVRLWNGSAGPVGQHRCRKHHEGEHRQDHTERLPGLARSIRCASIQASLNRASRAVFRTLGASPRLPPWDSEQGPRPPGPLLVLQRAPRIVDRTVAVVSHERKVEARRREAAV